MLEFHNIMDTGDQDTDIAYRVVVDHVHERVVIFGHRYNERHLLVHAERSRSFDRAPVPVKIMVHMNEKGIRFLSCPLDRHEKLLGIFA